MVVDPVHQGNRGNRGDRANRAGKVIAIRTMTLGLFLVLTGLWSAAAADRQAVEAAFQAWVANELWPRVQKRGVSRSTFKAAFAGVRLDWSLPDLRPPGEKPSLSEGQRQAEFRSPGRYFAEANLNTLVKRGRGHLAQWDRTLTRIERRFGVPRRIVVAIWGRESAYGRAAIPHNGIRALASQAFMGRRRSMFEAELLAALVILQEGHVARAHLKSSWAGGLGHPQFLPTAFLRYAVDFDGDGRRDIWQSVPDALASIAHYLQQNGWNKDRDWGYEVHVPAPVSCALEGPDQGRPIRDWVAAGIVRVANRRFSQKALTRRAYLLMPAGRFGPAYLVSDNFYVLKTFNESDVYALFIGHLADRYGNNQRFIASWQPVSGLNRGDVRRLQRYLEKRGADVGGVDGLVGFKTRRSIGTWQMRANRPVTCFPDPALMRAMGLAEK